MTKITEKTSLAEILAIEGGEEILSKYQVPCLTCPMAAMEAANLSIGQISEMYNLDLDDLLKELNKLLQKSK